MKLLHIYDHTYYEKDMKFYSSGAFGLKTWELYLEYFGSVTVVANLSDKEPEVGFDKLDLSSRDKVQFRFVKNYRSFKNYLKSYFVKDTELEKLISEHDAVVIRLPSELGLFAVKTARKLNKFYAIEIVGCAWDSYWYHGSVRGAVMAPLTFSRMKFAIRNASFSTYVTKTFLQDRYPTNGYAHHTSDVIIPPVDTTVLDNHIKRLAEKTPFRIGLAGTLNVKYKGHYESIKALAAVRDKIPPFELLFIGKGDTTWVEKVIKETGMEANVKILGKLTSGNAVFEFFDSLDLYLHPSKHEGLPRVVVEAMSRGCPVLGSSVAGQPELIPAEYLHKPGDYKTLSHQIVDVLNNKSKLVKMAKENFVMAQSFNLIDIRAKQREFWSKFAAATSGK